MRAPTRRPPRRFRRRRTPRRRPLPPPPVRRGSAPRRAARPTPVPMAAEARIRAMGSAVHVIVVGGRPGLVARAVALIDGLEARWSRFLPDSEVTRLNETAGRPCPVTPDTVLLVRRAIEGWRLTGGRFDPTVLGAVVRAGYDRSFDALGPFPTATSVLGLGCDGLTVDERAGTITLPFGVGFDPGGIGKGLAA